MNRGFLIVFALLTACGSEGDSQSRYFGSNAALLGKWSLKSVDGAAVSDADPVDLSVLNTDSQPTSLTADCSSTIEFVQDSEQSLKMIYDGGGRNGCQVNFLLSSNHSIVVGSADESLTFSLNSSNELVLKSASGREFLLARP